MRATVVAVLAALTLAVPAVAAPARPALRCPAAWVVGWQRLANTIKAPVYCPTWMPNPLNAKIGGQYEDIYSIGKDRSYLVSFLEQGDLGSGFVHVNFRGYPGRTTIPTCPTTVLEGAKTIHGKTPCFADPAGKEKAPHITATVYRVNQGADQWHILLAWKFHGSLYTVSQHVIVPYDSAGRVLQLLHHLLNSLVLVRPQPQRG
jgi:hypothetical protein